MGYYEELIKFLAQAKTDDLGTTRNNYLQKYRGLDLKVGFGQGGAARIPWISFLRNGQTTSNGIYPVYLYFKSENLLILAYGVSVTNKPRINWTLKNPKTISEYFKENNLGTPFNYGNSFVFKTYDPGQLPSATRIDTDLNEIIDFYLSAELDPPDNLIDSPTRFNIESFQKLLQNAGLKFPIPFIQRFVSSLCTKPFVILTGLSGSGKTKLAQSFVQWICEDKSQYRIIPVGADWTNREPLLGYPNALKPEEYVKPDSGVLDLIIQANNQPELPHFLILDEMNLSHVERYFADFLSVMESKEEIPLHSGKFENGVPAKLKVPSNLFIIGTVNIDETTNMFSPKVLDRANTIEFRVSQDEMQNFLSNIKEINMEALTGKGAGMAKSFLDLAANKNFVVDDNINAALVKFFGELKKTGAEFGYRSATEILRLIYQLSALDANMTKEQKIDIAIMQKLLPKLHGSRRKLCPVLETLGSFCISGDIKIVKDVFEKDDFDFNSTLVIFPLSLEKIARMYRGALDNGFASFAEA
jgi:5-methylcytosine-specific restriction protein B